MAKDSYIHLGKKPESITKAMPMRESPKMYYPSAHISGVEGMDVEDGDEVLMKGKVTSCTTSSRDGKKTYSCEVEVTHLKVDGSESSGGLDKALSKIEKEKMDASEETDEIDSTDQEDAEGE